MESKIVVFMVIDVIESLSVNTLQNGNLCMMDNSPFESTGQGTPELCTLCRPGQTIQWDILALDLQTPVAIRNITFLNKDGSKAATPDTSAAHLESDKLHLNVWSGIVPHHMVPGVKYNYRIEFQMYEGKNSIMYVDTPSLKIV